MIQLMLWTILVHVAALFAHESVVNAPLVVDWEQLGFWNY